MEQKVKFTCHACRWFDNVNGNTYHSVRITRNRDSKVVVAPWQYGYGEHYRQTALEAMRKAGWLPRKYKDADAMMSVDNQCKLYLYERENNYPIYWIVTDGLKRDMVANGEL